MLVKRISCRFSLEGTRVVKTEIGPLASGARGRISRRQKVRFYHRTPVVSIRAWNDSGNDPIAEPKAQYGSKVGYKRHDKWHHAIIRLHTDGERTPIPRACSSDRPDELSARGQAKLDEITEKLWWVEEDATTLESGRNQTKWWTFGGARANAALEFHLNESGLRTSSVDDLSVSVVGSLSAQ